MNKFLKLAALTTMSLALNGCFEVEDNNNNDDIVAALEQNQVVIQNPITLFGTIIDAGDQEPIDEATITVKVGAEWRPAFTTGSDFAIEELPVNTDVVVLIQSPTEKFMDRAFFGRTTVAEQGQIALQSMGDLSVSEGIVKTYSILESKSSEVFEGLVFNYNTVGTFSNNYTLSNLNNYRKTSTFDQATGLYSIILPKNLSFGLSASGDIDGDGIIDYRPENNNFGSSDGIYLSTQVALNLETMYVNVVEAYQPVELRISLIDKLGESIEDAEFFANDTFLGRLEINYDVDAAEYVFNYQTSSQISINMSSFTSADEVDYQSGSLSLSWSSNDSLNIYESGFANYINDSVSVIDGIAAITLQPRIASISSQRVSIVSSVIDSNANSSLKQFYQASIGLTENSVKLTQENVFKVIKGNDSANDIIPAGTTALGNTSQDISVQTSLSHNNTFLTAMPTTTLAAGQYRYDVEELVNLQNNTLFDSNWNTNFTIEPGVIEVGAFDINQIKLDNNNGTTNGAIIVNANTAGEANTATNNSSSTYLYFPKTILSLDYLELNLVSYVRNGNNQLTSNQLNIVNNGNLGVSIRNLVSLAQNEIVVSFTGSYYNAQFDTLTSLTDGEWYRRNSNILYAADNSGSSVNTATFNYIYRVAGENTVVEGSITLPVL